MPESAPGATTPRPSSARFAARSICALALGLGLIACAQEGDTPPVATACGADALGTQRTIELSASSGPVRPMLNEREIVLTFDDGPKPGKTNKILDVLASECVQATFFLRGDQAEKFPAMVRSIVLSGQTVGAHGWAHGALLDMTVEDARKDILRSVYAINDALAGAPETADQHVRLFRFPYVASNSALKTIVADLGLADVSVQADGKDWELHDPEAIVANVFAMLGKSGDRGVILLHDPFDTSVEATKLLLTRLKEADYRVVAIRGVSD